MQRLHLFLKDLNLFFFFKDINKYFSIRKKSYRIVQKYKIKTSHTHNYINTLIHRKIKFKMFQIIKLSDKTDKQTEEKFSKES